MTVDEAIRVIRGNTHPYFEGEVAGKVLADETERLRKRHSEIVEEVYGKGFQVLGWHLNGAEEPLDSWFEDNEWLDDSSAGRG